MKEKIEVLWNYLRLVDDCILDKLNYNPLIKFVPSDYRLDDLGAIIKKSEQGKNTEFGWTIDHIFPISKGGNDNIRNLQLLHWRNNEIKANDFPTFSYDTSYNQEGNKIENVSKPRIKVTVRGSFTESLSDLYPSIMQYWVSPLTHYK